VSTPFHAYASYYDLLYRDKDYPAEAAYVGELIRSTTPSAARVLELGCGTGLHALELSDRGYDVLGVDRSEDMIAKARTNAAARPPSAGSSIFGVGDARTFRSDDAPYDAVVALFHVLSYQTEDLDVKAMLSTARAHLGHGGAFVFDCWHGPAVLATLPETRVKRMQDDRVSVTRIAEPTLDEGRHRVDVRYDVFVRDKTSGRIEELRETHSLRYFFTDEIERWLGDAGFALGHLEEWMSGRPAGPDTWGVAYVAIAR
jgi:SAM-dependent methyltransferase